MNINVLAKWYPENWQNMSLLQLYGHFNMFFCAEMKFVRENGRYFEQLLSSNVFNARLRNVVSRSNQKCAIGFELTFVNNSKSDDIAKDFNEMTRTGKRNCMAEEFFNIWFRSILKQIIKPERFILGKGGL